jgi:hypothetical protein
MIFRLAPLAAMVGFAGVAYTDAGYDGINEIHLNLFWGNMFEHTSD